MDCCFLYQDEGGRALTLLVANGTASNTIVAHAVLCTGRAHDDTGDQAVASCARLGHHTQLLMKTGNAPAFVGLKTGAGAETV